jgi:FkbM family methyltransferase
MGPCGVLRLATRRAKALGRYACRQPHEDDFRYFARHGQQDGLFLDVGANLGQSAMSIRIVLPKARILSLEPNPVHRRDLAFTAKLVCNMDVRTLAAGASRGELTLHVPVWRGAPLTGEASLNRDAIFSSSTLIDRLGHAMHGPQFRIASFDVPILPIDELGIDPRWMKIDVQGTAPAVIRGARDTINRSRPVLMVESDGLTNAEVMALLSEFGYQVFEYDPATDELSPFADRSRQNLFFISAVDS